MRVVKSLDEDDAFSLGSELNLDLQQITDLREEYPDERDVVLFYVLHVSVMLWSQLILIGKGSEEREPWCNARARVFRALDAVAAWADQEKCRRKRHSHSLTFEGNFSKFELIHMYNF